MKKISTKKKVLLGIIIILLVLIYNGAYADISVDDLKKEYANEHSKFIEINGMQVHYRDEGKGFPIVLVHGTASSLIGQQHFLKTIESSEWICLLLD